MEARPVRRFVGVGRGARGRGIAMKSAISEFSKVGHRHSDIMENSGMQQMPVQMFSPLLIETDSSMTSTAMMSPSPRSAAVFENAQDEASPPGAVLERNLSEVSSIDHTRPRRLSLSDITERSRHSSTDSFTQLEDGSICFCNRVTRTIVCRACGHNLQGRIRKACPTHANVIHLMDHEICPSCKASELKEYGEVQ